MAALSFGARLAVGASSHRRLPCAGVVAGVVLAASPVQAQQPQSPPGGRIIVTGLGSVRVPPVYAQIRSGVTTRANTVKEANDANSKLMGTITGALLASAIAQTDIQTSRFSIQPVYAPPKPGVEPKLTGYSVSNQVVVNVREISKLGDILDRVVS